MRNQEKHAKAILPSIKSNIFGLLLVRMGLLFMYER